MMAAESTMGSDHSPISASPKSNRIIAELVGLKAPGGAAESVFDRDAQARDLATSMLRQGSSPADVWTALVASGVEATVAEAVVNDVIERERQFNEAVHQTELEAAARRNLDNEGNFWLGAVCGFIFAPLALMVSFFSSSMGGETKQGIRIGLGLRIALGVTLSVIFKK